MNILDENIPESQRQLLRSWRIRIRQIGYEMGRRGMKDEGIIPLLHRLRSPTFFTGDLGFYDHRLAMHATASFASPSASTRLPASSAVSCGIACSMLRPNGWAKSFG